MIDILLSDPFMAGIICAIVGLLILVTVVPMFTRRHQYDNRQWRVIEPPELLTEVTARRIGKANQIESKD